MMYEHLVKNLRDDTALQNCEFDFVHAWMHEAADAVEDLIVALTASNEVIAKSKQQWIPVTERLPEENGKYLTVHKINTIPPMQVIAVYCFAKNLHEIDEYDFCDKKHKCGFYNFDGEWGFFEIPDISHWMPLPDPPGSEGE